MQMPNNLEILAYIQAMEDRATKNLEFAKQQEENHPQIYKLSILHRSYVDDLANLRKFIKGNKQ